MALIEFELEDGSPIYMEVSSPKDGKISKGKESPIKATKKFEEGLETICPIANAIVNKVKSFNEPADEVEVKFGVKMSAEFGAVVASGNAEVNYEITLKWNNSDKA